jgi:hypothetical protein
MPPPTDGVQRSSFKVNFKALQNTMFKFITSKSKLIGKVLKYVATIITLTVSTFFVQSCVGLI